MSFSTDASCGLKADALAHKEADNFAHVRRVLPAQVYRRSWGWAIMTAVLTLALHLALTWVCYRAESLMALLLLAVLRGLSVGPVFIVAHDACHDSLSPSTRLNHWLGQVCFLPSWHSFTAWKVRHNHIHHRHTNILEWDSAYPPMTPERYRAASTLGRWLYRASRTLPGAGLLYFPEALRNQLFPASSIREAYRRVHRSFALEWAMAWAWLVAEVMLFSGGFAALGWIEAPTLNPIWTLLIGFGLAHAVWQWQMGFTTFLHHFHPDVAWYAPGDGPPPARRQLGSTVHVDLGPAHIAMLNIFLHTAHHVDTRIPLYRLRLAQHTLQQAFGGAVKMWTFSGRQAARCFAECKLWDPQRGRWTGY